MKTQKYFLYIESLYIYIINAKKNTTHILRLISFTKIFYNIPSSHYI